MPNIKEKLSSPDRDYITTLDLKYIQRKREYLFSSFSHEETEQTAFHTS